MTDTTDDHPKRSVPAIMACAQWLQSCLEMGWSRKSLDQLDAIWWEFHDGNGRLKSAARGERVADKEG